MSTFCLLPGVISESNYTARWSSFRIHAVVFSVSLTRRPRGSEDTSRTSFPWGKARNYKRNNGHDELFLAKQTTAEKPPTTNEEEHKGRLSGTWSPALLIRAPLCVEEVSLAPEQLLNSPLLCFPCFLAGRCCCFFTWYLNVWRGRGLLGVNLMCGVFN